jgi:archaellum component FlaC
MAKQKKKTGTSRRKYEELRDQYDDLEEEVRQMESELPCFHDQRRVEVVKTLSTRSGRVEEAYETIP